MTKSSHDFEKLGREARRQKREVREQRAREEQIHAEGTFKEGFSEEEREEEAMAHHEERTLRDLLAPNVDQQPLYRA